MNVRIKGLGKEQYMQLSEACRQKLANAEKEQKRIELMMRRYKNRVEFCKQIVSAIEEFDERMKRGDEFCANKEWGLAAEEYESAVYIAKKNRFKIELVTSAAQKAYECYMKNGEELRTKNNYLYARLAYARAAHVAKEFNLEEEQFQKAWDED